MALAAARRKGDDRMVLRSRVLTFHVESSDVQKVVAALDSVRERFAENPDFRGLVCLEGHGQRHQIMVLTLWDGDGIDKMRDEDEQARQQIADSCDLGVRSEEFFVVRNFAGNDAPSARTEPYSLAAASA